MKNLLAVFGTICLGKSVYDLGKEIGKRQARKEVTIIKEKEKTECIKEDLEEMKNYKLKLIKQLDCLERFVNQKLGNL